MPLAQPAPSVATTAFAHLYHKLSSHDRFPTVFVTRTCFRVACSSWTAPLARLPFALSVEIGVSALAASSLCYYYFYLSRPLRRSTKFPFISWQSCRTLGFFYNQLLLLLLHSNSHLQHALHLISASSRGCVTQARAARRFRPFYF